MISLHLFPYNFVSLCGLQWTSKWGLSSDKFNNLWLFSLSKGPSSTFCLEVGINFVDVIRCICLFLCLAPSCFFQGDDWKLWNQSKLFLIISAVYFYPGYIIVRATQMMSPLSIWKFCYGESRLCLSRFSEETIAHFCPFWISAYFIFFLTILCSLCFYCSRSLSLSLNDMGIPGCFDLCEKPLPSLWILNAFFAVIPLSECYFILWQLPNH